MPKIQKILLPVDFPNTSLPVIDQAAALAHRFRSEIVMLHVVTALSHAAGVPEDFPQLAGWDLLAEITKRAGQNRGESLAAELKSLTIRCVLAKGDPLEAILRTAQAEKADLIMMPSHGFAFNRFLLGSENAEVLYGIDCPVWTSAHAEVSLAKEFGIQSVLCAVDLGERSPQVVSWAAQIAGGFGAHLTLAHVTHSVELWGPGGSYVNPKWRKELVGDASQQLIQLRQDLGITADLFVGSGDMPKILSQAAKQTNADLLVFECYPYGGNLRIHGYAVIYAVPIPVLSV
jgi:nucleotide-binding universal stress UspA family protein